MRGTRHLIISEEQGYKAPNDKRIRVQGVIVTIKDLLILVQKMAKNEWVIHEDTIRRTGKFFFQLAVRDAIDGDDIEEICKKYQIPEKE